MVASFCGQIARFVHVFGGFAGKSAPLPNKIRYFIEERCEIERIYWGFGSFPRFKWDYLPTLEARGVSGGVHNQMVQVPGRIRRLYGELCRDGGFFVTNFYSPEPDCVFSSGKFPFRRRKTKFRVKKTSVDVGIVVFAQPQEKNEISL